MKYALKILILLLTLFIISCEKDKVLQSENCIENCQCIAGNYVGTFNREGSINLSANIDIEFTDTSYFDSTPSGYSPYICSGGYTCDTDSLYMQNTCAFTGSIDGTLILTGNWKYVISADTLILEKPFANPPTNGYVETYRLVKQ